MTVSDDYATLRSTLTRTRENWATEITESAIAHKVDALVPLLGVTLSTQERESLIRELLAAWSVKTDEGHTLTARGFTPWLTEERRQSIDWFRGDAYRLFLSHQGRPPASVEAGDVDSFKILGLLGDPQTHEPFDRRGLILGDVQSGKTSNYLALIGKAADAGYRLIVVLAGQTDRLRSQTQQRVDEGFIGRQAALDLNPGGAIGIGVDRDLPTVQSLTTVQSDFSIRKVRDVNITLGESGTYCVVLKKNKSVLNAFSKWLEGQPDGVVEGIPFLLLDDESDYASVNTRNQSNPDLDPTAINAAIRKLLSKFKRKTYVAYTATPFANIFINHEVTDDLFPRDFIYGLEAPSNYVGVRRVFESATTGSGSNVHFIDDAEESVPLRHKKDHAVEELPESLREALRAFAVHNALRDLRRDVNKPRSMLINVSRFITLHTRFEELVTDYWVRLKNAITVHARSKNWSQSHPLRELRDTYMHVFRGDNEGWDSVRKQLPSAVASVEIRTYNSTKSEADRDLSPNARIIAIGGAVLSRGLTLEGLGISYFYQAPRASDTLLQMGRWFGYRDGYEDLCHLWIDETVAEQFQLAYASIEDLRTSLVQMEQEKLTPRDFGLAVQQHPEALLITALNKMQSAEIVKRPVWAFAQRLETVRLPTDHDTVEINTLQAQRLIEELATEQEPMASKSFLRWENVSYTSITNFLADFIGSEDERPILHPASLADFAGRLRNKFPMWDVVVYGVSGSEFAPTWGGHEMRIVERSSSFDRATQNLRIAAGSARLAGRTDVQSLLPPEVALTTIDEWRRGHGASYEHKDPPEIVFYSSFLRPVLMLYLVHPKLRGQPENQGQALQLASQFLVAPKFVFPGKPYSRPSDSESSFVLNSVAIEQWQERRYNDFDMGDDDDDE